MIYRNITLFATWTIKFRPHHCFQNLSTALRQVCPICTLPYSTRLIIMRLTYLFDQDSFFEIWPQLSHSTCPGIVANSSLHRLFQNKTVSSFSLIYRIEWEARKQKWWLTYSNIVHPDPKDSPSPRRRCGSPTYIFFPRNARATWRRCSSPGWASSRSWWWRQRRTKRKRRRRRTRRIQSRRCDPRNPSGRRIASRPECIWSHRIGTHWCILCTTRSPRNVVTSFFFFLTYTMYTGFVSIFYFSFFFYFYTLLFFFFICFLSIFCCQNFQIAARMREKRKRKIENGKWVSIRAHLWTRCVIIAAFDHFRFILW